MPLLPLDLGPEPRMDMFMLSKQVSRSWVTQMPSGRAGPTLRWFRWRYRRLRQ